VNCITARLGQANIIMIIYNTTENSLENGFESSLIITRLRLFDQKYSTNNTVIYYYN